MVRCVWLLAICLVGCAPIPTMVPDMDRYAARRVSLESANGPQSPARTQAILQRLRQEGSGAGIFERHLAVEEAIAGSPLLVGNKITSLRDGPATFKAMFTAIREACDHINVETWQKQGGEMLTDKRHFPAPAPKGEDVARAVGGSPEGSPNPTDVAMLSAIRSAETGVHVTNAYFVPDPQMIAALTEAAARGVDVKIILPSTTDSGLVFHAGRSYYSALLRSGVKIYERRDAVLHAKTAVVDGVWSTIVSTNLDWRSFVHNNEVNAVILGGVFGAQMEAMFEADVARSDRITLERWQQRSLVTRMKETGARLWEYWL